MEPAAIKKYITYLTSRLFQVSERRQQPRHLKSYNKTQETVDSYFTLVSFACDPCSPFTCAANLSEAAISTAHRYRYDV